MKTVEVVAAIIKQNNTIFATQRGYGEFCGGWEFPGGKIEAGETPEQALIREIKEELNTTIAIDRFLITVDYDYPAFHLTMHCFVCHVLDGTLQLLEHSAAKWLTAETINSVAWLPADHDVVNAIRNQHILS